MTAPCNMPDRLRAMLAFAEQHLEQGHGVIATRWVILSLKGVLGDEAPAPVEPWPEQLLPKKPENDAP